MNRMPQSGRSREKALWRCSKCSRVFANRNQSHACARYILKRHFAGKNPVARNLFDALVAAIREQGPVIILPEKTRIAFQVRMSFAAVMVQKSKLIGHLVLARRRERPCFYRIESYSARNHTHHFRIERPEDIDSELKRWIAAAYKVGQQRHLPKSNIRKRRRTKP